MAPRTPRSLTAALRLDSSGIPADVAAAAARVKQLAHAGVETVNRALAIRESMAARAASGTTSDAKRAGLFGGGYNPNPGSVDADGNIMDRPGMGFLNRLGGIRAAGRTASMVGRGLTIGADLINRDYSKMEQNIRSIPLGIGELGGGFADLWWAISGATARANRDIANVTAQITGATSIAELWTRARSLKEQRALLSAAPGDRAALEIEQKSAHTKAELGALAASGPGRPLEKVALADAAAVHDMELKQLRTAGDSATRVGSGDTTTHRLLTQIRDRGGLR